MADPLDPQNVLPCRSVYEAHLVLDWLDWPKTREHRLIEVDGRLVAEYSAVTGDGIRRVLWFESPQNPLSRGLFGDDRSAVSSLLPPDVFWRHAEWARHATPENVGPELAVERQEVAAACYEEVVKFIPEGADAVPSDRLSDLGRVQQKNDPSRFQRGRLLARAEECRQRARHYRTAM